MNFESTDIGDLGVQSLLLGLSKLNQLNNVNMNLSETNMGTLGASDIINML